MTRLTRTLLSIAAIAFLLTLRTSAKSPIQVHIRNHILNAPATFAIYVSVTPDRQNRALVVRPDSGDYVRSSFIELDGDADSVSHEVVFRAVPAGDYDVTAQITGDSGVRGTAFDRLRVLDGR